MSYEIVVKSRAGKDLKKIPKVDATRIADKLEMLSTEISGDIKRLTNHTPEYRLRVGQYRILFEVDGTEILVYRILHRKEAYR